MLLMLDNYDSFTFNVVQYLKELGEDVKVVKNDELSVEEIVSLRPSRVVISPGPGAPRDAGVSMALIAALSGKLPILGVCLGHQCIAEFFGAKVQRAQTVMHGKTSSIHHSGKGVFTELPSPFTATRYHSLIVEKESLPEVLSLSAWTAAEGGKQAEVMGLSHCEYAIESVQFHPESIVSEHGHQIFKNFLDL